MNLLILGGTRFLGRHLVEQALARGHRVTLFNRGMTDPALFPQVERVPGDRDGGIGALAGRQWDAVIDTSGYLPRVVGQSARALRDAAGLYAFISSISVYAEATRAGLDEGGPLAQLADAGTETVDGNTYGGLKALCEQVVQAAWGGRALIIRPGLIVGRYDPTDRFTYWPWRIARGGRTLLPDHPGWPVQIIAARDLAAWTLSMCETGRAGTYNAIGPAQAITFGDVLASCARVAGVAVNEGWLPESFLLAQGVTPWSDLPLWIATNDRSYTALMQLDNSRAIAAGLTFQPLDDTTREALAWAGSRPADYSWRAGLTPEREAALLAAWASRA